MVRNGVKLIGPASSQYTYQSTAISSSSGKIALVSRADFHVYKVSEVLEVSFLCWGDINKRYAQQPKQAIDVKSTSAYYRSALSDEILAIASVQTFVDIRNARSGQRIRQLVLEPQGVECRSIAFSPDGQHLAIGLENGDILVYEAGLRLDFATRPLRVTYNNIPVTSVVFSHNSLFMAACTLDNNARVFLLSNLSDGCLEQFNKPSVHGKRSETADITDIDLYEALPWFSNKQSFRLIIVIYRCSPKEGPSTYRHEYHVPSRRARSAVLEK
jgi:WD40 repeat protein